MTPLVRIGALSFFVLTCALFVGCGGGASAPQLPPGKSAYESDTIRAGDKITVQLAGVPDTGFFVEKQVPPSGQISVSYLSQPFQAIGKTTAELQQEITDAYKAQKIYSDPVVTVIAEERYVVVGGEVRTPSNVPYRPDLTVVGSITTCGGFTEFANRKSIRVIRGSQVFYVDCIKAVASPGQDPAVYPGDQIYVSRTPF